jgi:hypothetical protein
MTPRSGLANRALPGWLAIPFLLLASVCASTSERGREASLDLQRLGSRAAHVSRELPKVDAGWNLSFESHVANSAAAIARNLATTRRESLHEGWAR